MSRDNCKWQVPTAASSVISGVVPSKRIYFSPLTLSAFLWRDWY